MLQFFRRQLSESVEKTLGQLLESQYWDVDKIAKYQWSKLKKIISHSFANVPYYRYLLNGIGANANDFSDFESFAKLPLLQKADIQFSINEMVAENVDKRQLVLNSTGGSTGMPLNFYQDRSYEIGADAARLRAWRYMPGGNKQSLEAVLWGAVRDIGKGFSFTKKLREILREGEYHLNTFDLDEETLKRYLFWFNRLKPDLLRGYATSLYYVANYIEQKGIKVHRSKSIISSTEVLHPRMRKQIEKVFGAPVFDSYGCREISQIGTECEYHDGFHVVFENQFVEIVDGKIVVTNLNNYAMPLLRYVVGDLAQKLDCRPCRCGRNSPRLINISGRDNDNIELPCGKVVNGEFFEFLFFGMDDVVQYQVVYSRSEKKIRLKLQLRQGGGFEKVRKAVKDAMRVNYNFGNVEIVESEDFDKTPTGKLRFVYMID